MATRLITNPVITGTALVRPLSPPARSSGTTSQPAPTGALSNYTLFFIWLLAVLLTLQSVLYFDLSWPIRDFTAFYQSAADFQRYGFLYATPHPYINLNAPHVTLLAFAPLLWLSEPAAAIVWQVVSIACLFVALGIVLQEVPLRRISLGALLGILAASCAVQHQWRQGQMGGILALVGTLAWRSARRQQPSLSGWLALTVSVKPWLVPLLLVEWRTLLRTVAIGSAGVLVGIWLCGLPNWTAWVATMGEHDVWPTPSNLGLFGMALRWSGQMKFGGDVLYPHVVQPFWLASSAVVFVVTCAVTAWQRPETDRAWLLWILAALLISPISWTYYLLVLIGPLVAWGEREGWPAAAQLAVALWVVPVGLLTAFWRAGSGLLGSLYTIAALLLWAAALKRPRATATEPARVDSFSLGGCVLRSDYQL